MYCFIQTKTVQHLQDQQVDLHKLNLAVPAFLRRSRRRHHHHHSNNDENTEEGKKYPIHGMGLNLANGVDQISHDIKYYLLRDGLDKIIESSETLSGLPGYKEQRGVHYLNKSLR